MMSEVDRYTLNIGSKKYSSWSLRVWLLMKVTKIPFFENLIPFVNILNEREFNSETKKKISIVSKTKRIPSLDDRNLCISESLPILEYLNDVFPEKNLWPSDIGDRAMARMISGVIYSNFHKTKLALPFVGDGRKKNEIAILNKDLQMELDLLINILPDTNICDRNDYVFGDFSITDAMLAPLIMRYYSYGVKIPDCLKKYIEKIISMSEIQQWIQEALKEKEVIQEIDEIFEKYPAKAAVKYKL